MLDANTIIAAALSPNGTSRRALAIARARGSIALSNAVFNEISEVLGRPKFASVLTESRRHDILGLLTAAAVWVEPGVTVTDCRDPKDNCYLELALATQAVAIVTGDGDLLALHPWRNIRVLNSADFIRFSETSRFS